MNSEAGDEAGDNRTNVDARVAELEAQLQRSREACRDLEQRLREGDREIARLNDRLCDEIAQRQRLEDQLQLRASQIKSLLDRKQQDSAPQAPAGDELATVRTKAAVAAHKLNNPLGVIMLAAQNALDIQGTDDAAEMTPRFLRSIIAQAERCGEITRDLTQLARSPSAEPAADAETHGQA